MMQRPQQIKKLNSRAALVRCTGYVVNVSIGGEYNQATNDAASRLANFGFFVGVATGNNNDDSRKYSTSSAAKVCCVGASTEYDECSSFSNYGSPVDVSAPGSRILSTWPGGGTVSDFCTFSSTSGHI